LSHGRIRLTSILEKELTDGDMKTYIEAQVRKREELGLGPRLLEDVRNHLEDRLKSVNSAKARALQERLTRIEKLEARLIKTLNRRAQGM
jgi:hypothetical protein